MNELKVFENPEFGSVRTVEIDREPWMIGKDVADILGYTNPQKAIRDHVDDEDKLTERIVLSGQNREVICINESGLYSLVLSSKLPSAKRFKRWVTSEILPSIRKHGMYAEDELLDNPDLLIKVAQALKEEREKNKKLSEDNRRMKPKEIFADAVSASNSSILVRDLAKIIRQNGIPIGEKRLYAWMREQGYICKGDTTPTQKAMELGLFEIIVRTIEREGRLPMEKKTTKVTGKGQQYFINKFLG